MRILFCGDIVGRSGREAVEKYVPVLRDQLKLDFVVANGENAANGVGITRKICDSLFSCGVDAITGGNHSWDQKEAVGFIDQEKRLLRPDNYPKGTPGRGAATFETKKGQRIFILNLMGRTFMDPLDDPFAAVQNHLAVVRLKKEADFMLLDFHGEASSEKMAMGHFVDGRMTAVVGTHTHIPTADAQIFDQGTGYQTDAGMCGDYNSVIGVKKELPIARFTRKMPTDRYSPAEGIGTFCGIFVENDDKTGLCTRVERVIVGPRLMNFIPE